MSRCDLLKAVGVVVSPRGRWAYSRTCRCVWPCLNRRSRQARHRTSPPKRPTCRLASRRTQPSRGLGLRRCEHRQRETWQRCRLVCVESAPCLVPNPLNTLPTLGHPPCGRSLPKARPRLAATKRGVRWLQRARCGARSSRLESHSNRRYRRLTRSHLGGDPLTKPLRRRARRSVWSAASTVRT